MGNGTGNQQNNPQEPKKPDIINPGPVQKSVATRESANKRLSMAQKAKSFVDKYCGSDKTKSLPYPNDPVSEDPEDLLAAYDALEARRSELNGNKDATKQESDRLNADYNAYFDKLRKPENLNKAFQQLAKMMSDDIATPVSGLEGVGNALQANNLNYSPTADAAEQKLIRNVKNADKVDDYLSLLLSASFKISPDKKSATENENMTAFYRDAKTILDTTLDMMEGRLFVPPKGVEKENGKTIHRTSTIAYEYENGNLMYGHYPLNLDKTHSEAVRQKEMQEYKQKDWVIEQGIDVNVEFKEVKHEGPLFFHEPCPEDIKQNGLGDCYMISTLQAIASQDPDFIKNAMVRNEADNSVTVRFFNEKMEPVYVTVGDAVEERVITYTINNPKPETEAEQDDNEPEPEYHNWAQDQQSKKQEKASPDKASKPKPTGPKYPKVDKPVIKQRRAPLYARRSHWIGILEKAYAKSGLKDGDTSKYENKPLEYVGNYGTIESGLGINFAKHFLGPYLNPVDEKEIKLPKSGTKGWGDYSAEEKHFLNQISEDIKGGKAVICSKPSGLFESENQIYERNNGLPGKHAYSIFDVKKDGDKLYVGVLDPNRDVERVYDSEKVPYMKISADPTGESWVELHEFCQTFDRVHTLDMSKGIVNKKPMEEAMELQRVYGEAVTGLCRELLGQDSKLAYLTNSRSFNQLSKAAQEGLNAFNSEKPNKERMKKALSDLSEKAREYLNYRKDNPKKTANELKETSAVRHFTAEAMVKLGEKVAEINQDPQNRTIDQFHSIELHQLKQETMNGPVDQANKAQRAARQYGKLVKLRNDIIQGLRSDAGYSGDSKKNTSEYQLPEEKLAELLYIDTIIRDRSAMTLDGIDHAIQPETIREKAQLLQQKAREAIPYMDKSITRKALFSVNPDQKLYAHFKEGEKIASMSPDKRQKALNAREQQKTAEEKSWKDSVKKEHEKEAQNAKKQMTSRIKSK